MFNNAVAVTIGERGAAEGVSSDAVACQFDIGPDAALAAIRTYEGPLLVDLDETLYLRNSTEDFIDCAWPGLLALLLLRVLDVLKPWRLTGNDTRDTWRVGAVSIFFPWTYWRWRAKAPSLAERYVNRELKTSLKARAHPPIILTSGFKPIVAPLVAAMGFADAPLVAVRMYAFADRRDGKLRMATRELGAETVASSLVVTDSLNDLDILQSCARPLRTLWPQARYRHALGDVYVPGQYISRIKRPGERYILGGILKEDFVFWFLSSIGLAVNPVTHVIGLLLLLLSFWAIYERGYVDNDLMAAVNETDPRLSAAYGKVQVATPAVEPWIWALLSGGAGVAVLHHDWTAFVAHFAGWVAVLILTYACFLVYNRIDKATRVWAYPLLQLARSAAFAVIVPIEPAGVAALGAHTLSRWVPYQLYRFAPPGLGWPKTRTELGRLISFVLLLATLSCGLGFSVLLTWSTLALLAWNVFKARRDIYAVSKAARRIDRPSSRAAKHGGNGDRPSTREAAQ